MVGRVLADYMPKILNVHVGTEAHIVGKVPAGVVRIFVDDDLVRVPEPVRAEGEVGCSDGPEPTIEPEPAGTTALNDPGMLRAETARKVAMLPWLVEMIGRIVAPGIMTNPGFTVIYVWRIGWPGWSLKFFLWRRLGGFGLRVCRRLIMLWRLCMLRRLRLRMRLCRGCALVWRRSVRRNRWMGAAYMSDILMLRKTVKASASTANPQTERFHWPP